MLVLLGLVFETELDPHWLLDSPDGALAWQLSPRASPMWVHKPSGHHGACTAALTPACPSSIFRATIWGWGKMSALALWGQVSHQPLPSCHPCLTTPWGTQTYISEQDGFSPILWELLRLRQESSGSGGWRRDYLMPGPLDQWSPTFLAWGPGFVEDNVSTDLGGGAGFRII